MTEACTSRSGDRIVPCSNSRPGLTSVLWAVL